MVDPEINPDDCSYLANSGELVDLSPPVPRKPGKGSRYVAWLQGERERLQDKCNRLLDENANLQMLLLRGRGRVIGQLKMKIGPMQ